MTTTDVSMVRVFEVAHGIRELLNSGAFKDDDRLPPVSTLAAEHGCGPKAVYRALELLKGEGRVYAVRGRGHYVMSGERRARLHERSMVERHTNDLLRLIADGVMGPGFKLGTINQLAGSWRVERTTVARALHGLAARGILIHPAPGEYRVARTGARLAAAALAGA